MGHPNKSNVESKIMSNGKGSKVRCGVCGYKIRGSNHNDGQHHKNRKKSYRQTEEKHT